PPAKALFNVASIALAVAASAHIAANLGGPSLLTADGGWSGLLVALIATIAQYTVSVVTVAGAVALDQRRSFWQIAWRRLSFKVLVEAVLGAIGAMFAAVLAAAPGWTPALIATAGRLFLGKQALDRGARRSRGLALTSAVGRAVATPLEPWSPGEKKRPASTSHSTPTSCWCSKRWPTTPRWPWRRHACSTRRCADARPRRNARRESRRSWTAWPMAS